MGRLLLQLCELGQPPAWFQSIVSDLEKHPFEESTRPFIIQAITQGRWLMLRGPPKDLLLH